MTKSEFILSLSEALAHLPGQERVRVLEYYEEMIDDRIESGMTEEDAVAALGSIEEILKEAAPEAMRDRNTYFETKNSRPRAGFFTFDGSVETLIANSASAELHIRSEELPDGTTARVDYNLSGNEQCACSLVNGKLEVRYKSIKQRSFSLLNLFSGSDASISITLSNPALVRGEISASSGSVDLTGLVFTDSLDAHTASGELDAHDVAVQRKCKLQTASGDITGHNLTCGELLEVHTASGDTDLFAIRAGKISAGTASADLTLANVECDELNTESASGDVEVRNIKSSAISLGSASGDLSLAGAECSGAIEMHSASGDIEIRDCTCTGSISLASTSGDIDGRLLPADHYSFSARSRSGDVNVPSTNGRYPVQIHTTSGDITFLDH